MATELKLRKGTTAEHSTFTGAEAEVTFDTDKNTIVGHDGTTAGGHPLVKEKELLAAVSEAADIDEAVSFVGRGAIVESGTNNNGSFVRWENGEQVCFNTISDEIDFDVSTSSSNIQASRSNVKSFPAEFSDPDYGIGVVTHRRSIFSTGAQDNTTRADSHDFRLLFLSSSSVTGQPFVVKYVAWGFWK